MIDINLLPGSVKRAPKRGLSKLGIGRRAGAPAGPSKRSGPGVDRTMAMIVGAWILALGIVGWLHFGTSGRISDVAEEMELARQDSARLAIQRAQGDTMRARERVLANKLRVIEEIDKGRFTYAHVMDEVSRTLPPYIWLVSMAEAASGDPSMPRVRIEGRAGNYFALGRFYEQLEASPFLQQVRLMSSQQMQVAQRTVYAFIIEFGFQDPPPDVIQTVPLFAAPREGN